LAGEQEKMAAELHRAAAVLLRAGGDVDTFFIVLRMF
jgi:hypothetical protein